MVDKRSRNGAKSSDEVTAAVVTRSHDVSESSGSEIDTPELEHLHVGEGEFEDDSDDLESSYDGAGLTSEDEGDTGIAGLDAIIAASRKNTGQGDADEPAGDGAEDDDSDGDRSLPRRELDDDDADDDAEEARLRERRRSGRLSSSSLMRDEVFLADPGSDSSEDERPDRNTIGRVPLEWYNEEDHIGYNREGAKLMKSVNANKIDELLARNDNLSLAMRTIYDPYNDEKMVLSREELKVLMNIQKGRVPEVHIDPYEDMVDWYAGDVDPFPIQNAPEPKRRFMPSRWEEKKVVKLVCFHLSRVVSEDKRSHGWQGKEQRAAQWVFSITTTEQEGAFSPVQVRAIRRGWIKPRKDPDEDEEPKPPPVYMLWDNDTSSDKTGAGLSYIPPPKPALPGHEESYHPPEEYLPSEEQRAAYSLMDNEDKPSFIPQNHDSLRRVPQYARFVNEQFERCLDLYLCPRVRSKRAQLKPEDLVPKALPKPQDLRPFPYRLSITYEGHRSKVRSLSIDPSGQWLLTGSEDGTMRMWEIITGRCHKSWDLGSKVHCVAWCPNPSLRLASCAYENKISLFATGVGPRSVTEASESAIAQDALASAKPDAKTLARWQPREDGGIDVVLNHQVRSVTWHARGDYFATVAPNGATQAVAVHQLSRRMSQNPFRKNRGRITCTAFHPNKPFFMVGTQNNVRIYNLAKQSLVKKLLAGGGVVTSIAVHPSGDHIILGTEDCRCLWFDLDLSSKPYKIMKYHDSAVRSVAFHSRYPLFATGSDDASAQIFHGMVYQDLMTNPMIVPVKILRSHQAHDFTGVLDVKFHPNQPWLLTAGGDGKACLFVD